MRKNNKKRLINVDSIKRVMELLAKGYSSPAFDEKK